MVRTDTRPSEGPGARREVACDHCGLSVPASMFEPGSAQQFCCNGCATVYRVIHESGLEHFYDLAARTDAEFIPAETTGKGYEEFDDPAFQELYARETGEGLRTVELYLEGVHCAACVWLVERLPVVLPGVAEARLDFGRSMARVSWDPASVSLSRVASFLDSVGYPVHPYRGVQVREMRRRENRSLLIRIAVAGAVAANVMMIAIALYAGMFQGMAAEHETFFRWTSLIVTLPAVIWSAAVFYKGAWGSFRTRTLHMDLPITVGILAGFGWGTANTIRGTGEIYFDSVTALIFLLLVGRYLQQRGQRAAADSAELLFSLAPSSARIVDGGETRTVALEALTPEMIVEVAAGESVPVDGVVVTGHSTLDTSLLTGESRPVPVAPGDPVHAGTVNLGGRVEVDVTAAGENTRVGRLMRMVEESAQRRAPVVQLADRISGWFVAAVLVLAAVTALIWWRVDPAQALDHAIALLIVTCPCALGLATPLAVTAAIGRAGGVGILIRGGDVLELLARPGRVFLDKTGTLTEACTRLVEWWGDEGVKPLVLAVEAQVAHPVARAFVEALEPGAGPAPEARVERSADGAGVRAEVDGRTLVVGSPAFLRRETGPLPAGASREVERFASHGLTPVLIALDGEVVAGAAFGDRVREDAATTIERLETMGWRPGILSGDHPEVVAAVGRQLGIPAGECHGGVSPEAKLVVVEQAAGEDPVVMVGDGINDAAALTAASVGVAVHGGAEVAMSVADVFLTRRGLEPLVRLFTGAQRTMSVIRRNLVFSLLYNGVGAVLAMTGWISPLAAAVLMPLSSLTVITYSFRARTF